MPPGRQRRESRRLARRREAMWGLKSGQAEQFEPTLSEAEELWDAVNANKTCAFGIVKLARLRLDSVVGIPPTWVRQSQQPMPLIVYAALRGRNKIVASWLRAGGRSAVHAPEAWLVSEAEANEIEAKLADLPATEAADLLIDAARMLEAGAISSHSSSTPAYAWKWIVKSYEWEGCGCLLSPTDAWKFISNETCPVCGEIGGPCSRPRFSSTRPPRKVKVWAELDDEEKSKRITRLHDASRKGNAMEVSRMISNGEIEDCDVVDSCGATAAVYAAIAFDKSALVPLEEAGANLDHVVLASTGTTPTTPRILIGEEPRRTRRIAFGDRRLPPQSLKVEGAFVVDDAMDAASLEALDQLYAVAPICVSDRQKDSEFLQRRHFIDAQAWLQDRIGEALASNVFVPPRLKFLEYLKAGAEMTPHYDLAKSVGWLRSRNRDKSTTCTTHTWILYLTDANSGATVLLEDLNGHAAATSSSTRVEDVVVYPKRGRLFVFKHRTPHAGQPVQGNDHKLIVRGELLFEENEVR